MKLGIRLDPLNLPFRRALSEAQRLGVVGVQLDSAGNLAPAQLSQTGRREVRHLLAAHDLELAALGCPLSRALEQPEGLDERLDFVRQAMALSFDLGCRLVVLPMGRVPEKPDESRLTEVLAALGQHGDRTGVVLALETGLDDGATLRRFLDRFDSGSLSANLDPADLLMNGFDPYESTRALRGRIALVHAKDARVSRANRLMQEVALGHGDIEWLQFLATLEEVEYRGALVVERETGEQRLADVAAGVAFLRRFVS